MYRFPFNCNVMCIRTHLTISQEKGKEGRGEVCRGATNIHIECKPLNFLNFLPKSALVFDWQWLATKNYLCIHIHTSCDIVVGLYLIFSIQHANIKANKHTEVACRWVAMCDEHMLYYECAHWSPIASRTVFLYLYSDYCYEYFIGNMSWLWSIERLDNIVISNISVKIKLQTGSLYFRQLVNSGKPIILIATST